MRVRRLLPIAFPALLLLPPASAGAGGWDSLDFPERQYLVGEVASVRSQFFAGALEGSGPLDGRTYHAYLLPRSRDELFGMIDAPTIPPGAIRLGALDVSGPVVAADGYPYAVAALSFTVPDVPSGTYAIGFCDDPCTYSTIGWLAWGRIRIVHTRYEGVLLRRLDRDLMQDYRLRTVARRAERASEEAAGELDRVRAELLALRQGTVEATTPMELRVTTSATPNATPSESSVTWWIALLGCLLGLAAGVAIGRRRLSPRVVVPDTVPDDLDEREPAIR
jgi:hypothetical protein